MAKKSSVEASKKNAHEKNELLQQERKKNLLLRFLVIILTLVIFSAWIFTLKNSWQIKKNNQHWNH